MKILVPISFLTSLLAYSGWIDKLDFIFAPVMGVIGLPPMAALPLIIGLLSGIYAGIAAIAALPFTTDQMTLMAIFLLISHNLIQESVIQSKSGMPLIKATCLRLAASLLTVLVVARFMDPATSVSGPMDPLVLSQQSFLLMIKGWTVTTFILSVKMFFIIMILMILLEIMKAYHLIDRMVRLMAPIIKAMGLEKETGFLWLTAVIFGLAYGAAVIVEETKEANFSKDALEELHLSIGINHSMIEDPAVFLSLGLNPFLLWVPRIAVAILAVWLLKIMNTFLRHLRNSKTPVAH